ncbi:hypothetical protein ALC62_08193 [Cyphomyrmex costatus]|uniref:Uncharacterized protein n=1 Tax=Cyphomyrmex costatus TaxID=456900 RepID=A0A195CKI4_9HYME|nr:hypothetical protein ALC62_08193 [Cyphomyrmex costatus]
MASSQAEKTKVDGIFSQNSATKKLLVAFKRLRISQVFFNHTSFQTSLNLPSFSDESFAAATSDTRIGKFIASTRARGLGIVELVRFVSSSLDLDTRR